MHGLIFFYLKSKLVILLYLKNKKNILASSFKNSKLKGN